jgi:hypothetical protein
MLFLIKILVLCGIFGAVFAFFFSSRREDAFRRGIAEGIAFGMITILQFMLFGFFAMIGIWLIGKIF